MFFSWCFRLGHSHVSRYIGRQLRVKICPIKLCVLLLVFLNDGEPEMQPTFHMQVARPCLSAYFERFALLNHLTYMWGQEAPDYLDRLIAFINSGYVVIIICLSFPLHYSSQQMTLWCARSCFHLSSATYSLQRNCMKFCLFVTLFLKLSLCTTRIENRGTLGHNEAVDTFLTIKQPFLSPL